MVGEGRPSTTLSAANYQSRPLWQLSLLGEGSNASDSGVQTRGWAASPTMTAEEERGSLIDQKIQRHINSTLTPAIRSRSPRAAPSPPAGLPHGTSSSPDRWRRDSNPAR